MEKKGFIATSLIYSFFLVFIAILMALLNNFIANKTILERFNDDVEDSLNNKSYSLTLYAKNANIQDGATLSNLINDSSFVSFNTEKDHYWFKNGDPKQFGYEKKIDKDSLLIKNVQADSNVYQTIKIEKGNKYYYAIKYVQPIDAVLNTYIDNKSYGTISTTNSNFWTKASNIFEAEENIFETGKNDAIVNFVVGDASSSYAGNVYFTEAMVLNLTAAFGAGNEPALEWIEQNIKYFEGTRSYIKLDKIKYGASAEIRVSPFTSKSGYTIECTPDIVPGVVTDEFESRLYATLTFDTVERDTVCTITWDAS